MNTWACPKKIRARHDTIVDLGKIQGQYWSMAGKCDGPGCEIDQILEAGIITPEQFHGVEIQRDIYDFNVETYPLLQWHCGDFLNVMRNYPDFQPGLVNADLLQSIKTAAQYVGSLLYLLTPYDAKLVVNLIMDYRGIHVEPDEVMNQLLHCQQYRHSVRAGWTHNDRCYLYPGTGHRSKTVMGTFVFQR